MQRSFEVSDSRRSNRVWKQSSTAQRALLAAGCLVAVAACTDQSPTGLATKLPGTHRLASTDGSQGRPTLFSNAVKYRDAGMKPATGRSGSASLSARALLGKDGATTLDISTGEIDGVSAPGSLKKIQLKQFDPNGTLQITTNHQPATSPTLQLLLSGRVRGSNLQVQGNVTGIDPNRTDVVTITEKVKLRPDLAVSGLTAPAEAVIATEVNISALVSEQNGDVGARSDCVLSVDGAEVDRADGIWVDAGRSVSCLFAHTFTALGSKQLTVSVTNVNPGDFDGGNNSASASINIVAPPSTNDFTWYASFDGLDNVRYRYTYDGYWSNTYGEHGNYSGEDAYRWLTQRQTGVSGTAQGSVGFPVTMQFTDRLDGAVIHEIVFDPLNDPQQPNDNSYVDGNGETVHEQGGCAQAYRIVPGTQNGVPVQITAATLSMCTYQYTGGSIPPQYTATYFNAYTSAGDVSYYSRESVHTFDVSGNESVYSYNYDVTTAYDSPVFGNEYSFAFSVTGPNGTKKASGSLAVTSHEEGYSSPYSCYDYSDSYYTARHSCSGIDESYTRYTGSAHGTPDN